MKKYITQFKVVTTTWFKKTLTRVAISSRCLSAGISSLQSVALDSKDKVGRDNCSQRHHKVARFVKGLEREAIASVPGQVPYPIQKVVDNWERQNVLESYDDGRPQAQLPHILQVLAEVSR